MTRAGCERGLSVTRNSGLPGGRVYLARLVPHQQDLQVLRVSLHVHAVSSQSAKCEAPSVQP